MKPNTSPHVVYSWIQKMNNSAALCLEIGKYDRAITSLAKVLTISRAYIEDQNRSEAASNETALDAMAVGQDEPLSTSLQQYYFCSFDGCVQYSEEVRRNCHIHRNLKALTDNRREETIRRRFLQRRQERRSKDGFVSSDRISLQSQEPFLYKNMIQVPPLNDRAIRIDQIATLSIITIFNLAVVYHLRAMDSKQIHDASTISTAQATNAATIDSDLRKALGLYEVAYKALDKKTTSLDIRNSGILRASIQFKLILCNNLSYVHNLIGNQSQHEIYLREVLSATMSLIDFYRNLPSSSQQPNNRGSSDPKRSDYGCIDLEGFLANAAPLMTEAVCADAA